eukprot:TRINITY_DN4128_c0_g1_i1.p1 TRINITY_DN4128_c0_g1~~TRINITY_DN4128_c0_g1_i1.p1  ORF type:complete len:278 (-),score=62.88 TRINITY_DN4128_c0_g1_i1:299-1132(-)
MAIRKRAVASTGGSKDADDVKGAKEEKVVKKEPSRNLPFWIPVVLSLLVAIALPPLVIMFSLAPQSERMWYPDQLKKYDGSDEKLPIYIGFLGLVFDVTEGKKHYGKGGAYNHFAGRDATLAFVTNAEEDLTDDLSSLDTADYLALESWREFYPKTYKQVGKIVGRFYDSGGDPTDELKRVRKEFYEAEKLASEQKALEERFPNCNSRWSQDEGGEVWCPSGYPRKVFKASSGVSGPITRCGCFGEDDLNRPDQEIYEGCEPLSQRCVTSPPQSAAS